MTDPRYAPTGAHAHLRLLATTDLHMNLTSYDYYADRPDPTVGLTRTAMLIRQARAEADAAGALVLLFDNGDGLQGTPLCDTAVEQPDRQHPLMRAFSYLRYDAVGLGNHDFNFGLKQLDLALQQAPCPVISSNLHRLCNGKPAGFEPFAILDRMVRYGDDEVPIRIGVLSFLPPQTVRWDAHHLRGQVQAGAIVQSARRWLPELRAAGCDVIIALAHSGLCNTPEHPDLENAALPLAALDGIDAVISGHTHLRLPGPDHCGLDGVDAETGTVHGKPVVMPGMGGSHLGVIDLDLVLSRDHRWTVSGFTCGLRPIARRTTTGEAQPEVDEDQTLCQLLSEDHAQTRSLMDQPVGFSATSLHSYFTFFGQDRALAVVAAAQAAALRPCLQGTAAGNLPLLSATAPGKFGGRGGPGCFTDVAAGTLAMRHVADLHVFPNQLCAVIATGEQVRDWLEMSASLFHQIDPGACGQMLIDPAMPGHDFDVLHGLSYQIDLSVPARFTADGTLRTGGNWRVLNLEYNGVPIRRDDRFVVALNSYRASGGGPFAVLSDVTDIPLPPMSVREVIRDYVADLPGPDPVENAPAPWRFAPMPGTTVTALTGPGARAYMAELCGRGIVESGMTPEGFLRLTIPL